MKKDLMSIVVAGSGLVGRRHVRAIQQTGRARVNAIVDLSDQAELYAKELGLPFYETLGSLFENERPDGVILATPTQFHFSHGIECIDQGCPTLIEKPIAFTVKEAAQLVALSESRDVQLLVGHHRRYNPLISEAKQAIMAGKIGEVRAVHVTCWFYKPDAYFEAAPWRKKKGAGPISVNLVHDVDLLRYLCGEIVSVQAQATPSKRGYENEDMAAAVFRFANNVIGTITVSDSIASPWSWELTSGEHPIYHKTEESCYQIGGSHGAFSIPDLKVWKHAEKPDWWSPIHAQGCECSVSDPLVSQINHFIDVIERRAKPIVSGREGLKTLEVIEAMQLSAQKGMTIELNGSASSM